ncbi:MAG: carboxyl transferase domain-containing protein, partial [Acidimicrobiales bacterium]
ANPYVAAERGYVDDVIDPADTRRVIVRSLDLLASKREELPHRKHGNIPLLAARPRGPSMISARRSRYLPEL